MKTQLPIADFGLSIEGTTTIGNRKSGIGNGFTGDTE